MSDTPETDDQPCIMAINENGYQVPCVDIEYARKLERERDEANYFLKELAEVDGQIKVRINELCEVLRKTEKERDEAREEAAHWKTEYEIVVDRLRGRKHPRDNGIIADDEIIPKLERERDEVRDELCHLRACVFDVMSALDAGAFTELRKAWEEGAK